jgi:hypothetical protein
VGTVDDLISALRVTYAGVPDKRRGKNGQYLMADIGMAAASVFFMQCPSFLAHQRHLADGHGHGRSNCQSLFAIEKIPSDNYIRDMLDEADPALLAPCFERPETLLAEPPMRQAFARLGGRTLVAWDETEYLCSPTFNCVGLPRAVPFADT